MERIRDHLFNNFRTMAVLSMAVALCIFLLMIRLKIAQSYFLIFLVWNLFLAFIPFGITFYLSGKKKVSKLAMIAWFGAWMLFLPNAPYIVTDFIHLTHAKANLWILDLVLISSYALCGLLFYCLSLREMEVLLRSFISFRKRRLILWAVPFLAGFGVYLGRFLRWNSWDAIQRPGDIFRDVWEILAFPSDNKAAWLFTFFFGIGLGITYRIFRSISFFRRQESSVSVGNSE